MFPAGAGMNRQKAIHQWQTAYVPRRRGDEPVINGSQCAADACSPQARG